LHLFIASLKPAYKRFLHNIFGVCGAAQHPIGDCEKVSPILIEGLRALF
jgi:hypothetical protein